jgi:hypothetical protein
MRKRGDRSAGLGLRSRRYRGSEVVQRKQREGDDLHAPLSPEEFADLVAFADRFGDSPVLDKPMPRFQHLKRLETLGFIAREDDGSLYVTPFGKMRTAQGH